MSKELYIAVVITPEAAQNDYVSGRNQGDWAAFVHENQDVAVERALTAARRWSYRDYKVMVGKLTGSVHSRPEYVVVPF
jgi:hypothetical protein